MVFNKQLGCWKLVFLAPLVCACKPPEPVPSQYTNLGTAEAPLLPPPQPWHDPSVAKGTSELRPFRKPAAGDEKSAAGKATSGSKEGKPADPEEKTEETAGGSGAEKEIRTLVADFNAALAEKKLDEASEFLSDAQAQASGDVFAAVHSLVEQLKLLQAATPALTEKIAGLVPILNIADSLKVELQSVKLVDEKNAMATLVGGSEARFVVGEEDLWYLESPMLALLDKERARIQKVAKDIEEALAKGTPDEAAVTALGTALDELRTALTSPAKAPADSGGA